MKILIVRVSSLGDVVHNMPMLADIVRHHPDAVIDWVVEEAYVDLVRLNRHVRHVIPIALRRWRRSLAAASTRAEMLAFYRQLRADTYDVIFDTQGLLKTGLVMQLARRTHRGRRIGLANATEGSGYEAMSRLFHTESVNVAPRAHAVQRGRCVAARALGYSADHAPDFALQAAAVTPAPAWLPKTPYTVFFHASAGAAKQWPAAHWIAIAQLPTLQQLPLLLPWGSASERWAAEQLAQQLPNAQVLPRLNMLEAVLLAQQAALVIGVDTGLTHVAAACGRPTIELYCASPRWKTAGTWSPSIINLGDNGQPPSVAEVEHAVLGLLAAPAAAADSPEPADADSTSDPH